MAAGLYYIAEWVEEYTVLTAKIIKYLIYTSCGVYIGLLMFERIPFYVIAPGLLANGVYAMLLNEFPYISLTSIWFLSGVGFVFLNHYLAFSYFASIYYEFSEILAYFTICLWLVPFSFFVSLSVNEYTLPTMQAPPTYSMGGSPSTGSPTDNVLHVKRPKRPGILGLFDFLAEKKENLFGSRKDF